VVGGGGMTAVDHLEIKDLERVNLQPGDVLIVHIGEGWGKQFIEVANARLTALFPNNRVLLLGPDVTVEVVNDGHHD
jgi:protein involved in polysaccharide export with SLBB domain